MKYKAIYPHCIHHHLTILTQTLSMGIVGYFLNIVEKKTVKLINKTKLKENTPLSSNWGKAKSAWEMLPGLHSCSRSITASSVKIVIINRENNEEYYICSPSVLSSTMERNNLHNFFNDRIKDDVQVQEDDLLSGCCARKNCNKEKCRKDLLLKKPVSTSQKTDQNSSIKFCSLDHMMLYLSNLSENKWNRRILIRNGNTTIESSNGMCCLNNQY